MLKLLYFRMPNFCWHHIRSCNLLQFGMCYSMEPIVGIGNHISAYTSMRHLGLHNPISILTWWYSPYTLLRIIVLILKLRTISGYKNFLRILSSHPYIITISSFNYFVSKLICCISFSVCIFPGLRFRLFRVSKLRRFNLIILIINLITHHYIGFA